MESEDIIATQPDTRNFEEDNKNSLKLNGTLLSDTQTSIITTLGLTNFTSSKTSFESLNNVENLFITADDNSSIANQMSRLSRSAAAEDTDQSK